MTIKGSETSSTQAVCRVYVLYKWIWHCSDTVTGRMHNYVIQRLTGDIGSLSLFSLFDPDCHVLFAYRHPLIFWHKIPHLLLSLRMSYCYKNSYTQMTPSKIVVTNICCITPYCKNCPLNAQHIISICAPHKNNAPFVPHSSSATLCALHKRVVSPHCNTNPTWL